MGFFRRLFSNRKSTTEMEESSEDDMLSTLQEQYQRDIEQDVSAIESILDSDEEQPEMVEALPAPDYDSERTTVEEALLDTEMENFSEKNVVEHNSIEDIGNHLKSASIVGDIPSEVSFDPPSETTS